MKPRKPRTHKDPATELILNTASRTSFWGDKSMVGLRRVRVEDCPEGKKIILISQKVENHSNFIVMSNEEFAEMSLFFQAHKRRSDREKAQTNGIVA